MAGVTRKRKRKKDSGNDEENDFDGSDVVFRLPLIHEYSVEF